MVPWWQLLCGLLFSPHPVPGAAAAAFVGRIQPPAGQWTGARRYILSGGETLCLRRRADTLFLDLLTDAPGWAHVYLATPDSVWVLHASAALGQQLYVRRPPGWLRRSAFRWELRATDPAGPAAVRDYFRHYGWSATVRAPGAAGPRAFRLRLPAYRRGSRLSVVYATAAGAASVFPRRLTDDTCRPALLRGGPPDTLRFQLMSWHRLPGR